MGSWTFYIATFGCKVNQYESQAIREAWRELGGTECMTPASVDAALVNSCAVTAKGERDARNALYRLYREAPAARRILTGCSARLVGASLKPPVLDVLTPPRDKALLLRGPWDLPSVGRGDANSATPPFGEAGFSIAGFQRARPVVKVQDGCSHRCTYCIVPLMRGPAVSRPAEAVLAETTALLEAGYGEIMLSGINLHQYGRGLPPGEKRLDFWGLLRMLDSRLAPRWAGQARLRLSSLEPTQLNARALDILSQCRMLCPHIHLSLQHGSVEILRRMGRGHCRPHRLVEAVRRLRGVWPVMGLGADLLMGFPGETEGHVTETLEVVRELGLTYAHVFPYSERPGTAAAGFDGRIPNREKLARAAAARDVVAGQKRAFLERLLQLPVLHVAMDSVHETEASLPQPELRGVSEHYAPCRLASVPAPPGRGMLKARPLRVHADALLVEALP